MSIFSAALTLNKHTDQPWEAYLGESAVLQEPKASFPPLTSLLSFIVPECNDI